MITQTACLALRQIGQRPNSTIDDRDTGVVETPAGSILVTHFTSLAYEPILDRAERTPVGQPRSTQSRATAHGYRRAPFGNQARVSTDNRWTWSEPMTLSGDGTTGDLGYLATVECDDGVLVTVWYEVLRGSPLA
ncbi:MAG: hypothetical protein NTY42_19680 [Planctomycetota bacterium]|jgi:hypothetical protein|nr:hypothetical protein [Planctomycetota bacterium]